LGLIPTRVAANAAKESANTARRTLEITQAADVSVIAIANSDETHIRPGSVIEVIVKNHGKTRADGLTISVSFSLGGRTVAVPPPPAFVLPAETARPLQLAQAAGWLADHDFMDIEIRSSNLSVLVEIRYRDVFGADHLFTARGVFIVGRGFVMAGNESDPAASRLMEQN
jgi:hypothetical protein